MDSVRETVAEVDQVWQWLAVLVVSAVPYVESYGGAAIGVVVGVPVVLAVVAAVVGNAASMVLTVTLGDRINRRRRSGVAEDAPVSPRRARLRRTFDRWGVPGVSLLGQTLLPSQITAMAMVSFGADRRAVVGWQLLSITLWGVGFGAAAAVGVQALA